MAKEKKILQTWGYNKDGESQIFDLEEGEKLPAGWVDTPAKFKKADAE